MGLDQTVLDGFCGKIIDASSFLAHVVDWRPEAKPAPAKLAYHAPCHLCRGLGVHDAPRELLARAGLEYLPYAEEEVCCGFGGSFSVDFPMLSARILGQKLDNIETTGAEAVVTDLSRLRAATARRARPTRQRRQGLPHRGGPGRPPPRLTDGSSRKCLKYFPC